MSEGHKDVLYIDVEDDITSIIGKVKASKHKIIAVVPPKRVGVLQSAVNLRLLARAAKQDEKHLVLITTNHALLSLAAAASVPVAKNLQAKPELAEVPQVDDDDINEEDDVINGEDLPVGEHARQSKNSDSNDADSAAITAGLAAVAAQSSAVSMPTKATGKPKKALSVPNFDSFRKKLLFGVLGGIFLIGFMVWALVFAPRATVIISAKTTSASVNSPVTIATGLATDVEKNTLAATTQQQQTPKTIEFSATGQKDVGSKAKGTIKFSAQTRSGVSIAAGSALQTSGGLTFITDSSVYVPPSDRDSPGCFPTACAGTASVGVTAAENGSKYNAATGSVSGTPTNVTGSFASPTSGGVSKLVTVVTNEDIEKAKEVLNTQGIDTIKADLKSKFAGGGLAIDESFVVEFAEVSSNPAVDTEATDGKAVLSAKVTYKMFGVSKDNLKKYIDGFVAKDLDGLKGQRIYDSGTDKVVLQEVSKVENGAAGTLIATAQVGPKIEDDAVREQVKGKRYGEIQQVLQSIQGVDSVDVNLSPFWVSTVPEDDKKISIEFKLNESN